MIVCLVGRVYLCHLTLRTLQILRRARSLSHLLYAYILCETNVCAFITYVGISIYIRQTYVYNNKNQAKHPAQPLSTAHMHAHMPNIEIPNDVYINTIRCATTTALSHLLALPSPLLLDIHIYVFIIIIVSLCMCLYTFIHNVGRFSLSSMLTKHN